MSIEQAVLLDNIIAGVLVIGFAVFVTCFIWCLGEWIKKKNGGPFGG